MTNQDKIKLAEARGYVRVDSGADHWWFPKGSAAEGNTIGLVGLPDPFINANDDYVVLEWMRSMSIKDPIRLRFFLRLSGQSQDDYKIGNYARAALKEIERV